MEDKKKTVTIGVIGAGNALIGRPTLGADGGVVAVDLVMLDDRKRTDVFELTAPPEISWPKYQDVLNGKSARRQRRQRERKNRKRARHF